MKRGYPENIINRETILNKHLYLLQMVKEDFPCCTHSQLSAKLYLLKRVVGSFRCNKHRYEVCISVIETDTFTATGESFKINQKFNCDLKLKFNCDDKCLIHLLTCNQCRKQYVGQT